MEILPATPQTFADTLKTLGVSSKEAPDGHYVDPLFPSIVYLPESAVFSLREQAIHFETSSGEPQKLRLSPDYAYVCLRDTRWK